MKHTKHLQTLTLCGLALLQIGCAQAYPYPSQAHYGDAITQPSYGGRYAPMPATKVQGSVGNAIALAVVDASTKAQLPVYYHRGEYWVAGLEGQRYELQLTSRVSGRRVLATTSVDGINVISGQTAAALGRGYVLSPHNTSAVQGWRKSEHEVAAFNFAAPQASYAAQTGRPANVGVIGVAVFPEALPPPRPQPMPAPISSGADARGQMGELKRKDEALVEVPRAAAAAGMDGAARNSAASSEKAAAPAAEAKSYDSARRPAASITAPSVAQGLGTQHGQSVSSYAPTVAFQRESNSPSEVITLRYDSVENLVARGVLQWVSSAQPVPLIPRPAAFPAGQGFVPDPPRLR